MLIASKTIPEIQKALDSGRSVPADKQGRYSASLSALLYLAVAAHRGKQRGDCNTANFIAALGLARLQLVVDLLAADGRQKSDNAFGTYDFEVYRIGSRQDLLTDDWVYFCDRFRRAASRRKQSPAVLAIASVFREMADNVVCHAYEVPHNPCRALAGYHVTDSTTAFSVVDDGQGFLRSLQRNPLWARLRDDGQALDAVVSKQATSRPGEKAGGGFKQLFNGLLNLNGMVILRTGRANFTLRNDGDRWQRVEHNSHHVTGSQITLVVGRNGSCEEEQA